MIFNAFAKFILKYDRNDEKRFIWFNWLKVPIMLFNGGKIPIFYYSNYTNIIK